MLKLYPMSVQTANNLLNAAHSTEAAMRCNSHTVAIICRRLVMSWISIEINHRSLAREGNRVTEESEAKYRNHMDTLHDLLCTWNRAVDDTARKRDDYSSYKAYRKAKEVERKKVEMLMRRWDDATGTWNFGTVVFG